MIDRLIEIVIPDTHKKEMQEVFERYGISEFWQDKKAALKAMVVWLVLPALLVLIIIFSSQEILW